MKITPTMRRMVRDAEFRDAVAMLIEAQDKLREIEQRNRGVRRNVEPTDSVSAFKRAPR